MNIRNLKLALIASATYLAATLSATGIMAWIVSELTTDGTVRFVNAAYLAVLAIGLIVTFAGGYGYDTLLSRSMFRYARANTDVPEDLVRIICKGRLLSLCYGYAAAVCLLSAALTFAFSGEAYIETICLLMGMGFPGLIFSLQYRYQSRRLYRQRFSLSAWG